MSVIENALIGERLRGMRLLAGISIEQISELLQITERQYRRLESGTSGLDAVKLLKLIEEYGVDPMYLLTGKKGSRFTGYAEYYNSISPNEVVYEMMGYCKEKMKEDEKA